MGRPLTILPDGIMFSKDHNSRPRTVSHETQKGMPISAVPLPSVDFSWSKMRKASVMSAHITARTNKMFQKTICQNLGDNTWSWTISHYDSMTDFCISMTNKFQRDVWHTMEAQKGETWFRFFFLRLRVKRRASSTMVPKDYVPLLSGYKFVRCSKRENEIAELLAGNGEANSKQNTKKKHTNNTKTNQQHHEHYSSRP